MKSKDQVKLEEAYKSIHEGGMPPTAGAASRAGATGGAITSTPDTVGKKDQLSDATMQAGLAILQQYAQGEISNVEAANMFDELYKKGAGHGPTQDDQHNTKLG